MLCTQRTRSHLKTYLLLVWPICLRIFSITLLGLANGVLARHLHDKNALTTLELSRKFLALPTFFFMGIANILSGIVIEAHLARSYQRSSEALKSTLLLALLFLLPCTLFLFCFSKSILQYWGQPQEVVALTGPYLATTALALFPIAFSTVVQRYLQGLGRMKTNMRMTLLQAGCDLFIGYVCVYGKFGLAPMGLAGLAAAFLISRVFMAFLCVYHLVKLQQHGVLRLGFRSCMRVNVTMLRRIFFLGLFLGFSLVFRMAFKFCIMIVIGRLGAAPQKMYALIRTVARPGYAFVMSIAIVGRILMGKYQQRPDQQYIMGHVGYALMTIVLFLVSLVFYIVFVPFVRWLDHTATPTVLAGCQAMLPLEILLFWIDGLSLLSIYLLSGMKETIYPALVSFFSFFMVGLPLVYLFTEYFVLGLQGIYLVLILVHFITFALTYLGFRRKIALRQRGLSL